MTQGRLFAGVELGGTKCVCILASGPDDIREQVRLPTTTPSETLAGASAVLERWRSVNSVDALGLASFGPLDLDAGSAEFGRIVSTPKPGWSGADLKQLSLGEDTPVAIDTDVNGAALAEMRWGAARGLDSFAYITVGTGIGVGIIVNGRPVAGLGHAEAGHLRIGRMAGDVWPGSCPYHGDCAEGLASGPAIAARAGKPAEQLPPDDSAWTPVAHALGGLLHNLVLTATPQRILIGGGVAVGQPGLLPRIRAALLESLAGYGVAEKIAGDPDFVSAPALGDRAGPLGAIAVAMRALDDQAS